MRTLLRSGSISLVQNVAGLVFGVGSFVMLTRIFPKDTVGIWANYMNIITLLEVARNGLVQNAKINFLNQYSQDEPVILKASLVINLGVSLLSALFLALCGGLLASYWAAPVVQVLFWIYALTSLVLVPFTQVNILQQSRMHFGWVAVGTMLRTGGFFFFILAHVLLGKPLDLVHMAWAQLFIAMLAAAVVLYGIRGQWQLASGISWVWVRRLLHFGKYVFGTNLSAVFYNSIDQILLGRFTKSVVAEYNAAVRINTLAEVPIATAASVIYPYKVQLMAREGEQASHEVFYKSVGAITGLLLPVVLAAWIFPELILTLIAGQQYADAAPLLRILATSALVQPFLRQFGTQMDSSGRPHLNFMAAFGMAILNTVLNYVAIRYAGATGAACATLFTQFAFLTTAAWLLNSYFGISLWKVVPHLGLAYQLALDKAKAFLRKS